MAIRLFKVVYGLKACVSCERVCVFSALFNVTRAVASKTDSLLRPLFDGPEDSLNTLV